MERTLILYDLILEKNRQFSLFEDSSFERQVSNFCQKNQEDDFIYLNRPDNVIVEIITISEEHIFGSYGRVEQIDDRKLIRSRKIDDYSIDEIETLIETYTYFYLDVHSKKTILLNNSRCGGFKSYFVKFLDNKFKLESYYDSIKIVIQKDENIKEKLLQRTNLEEISIGYTSDKLVDNAFINPNELYDIETSSIKSAKITLSLMPTISNQKMMERISEEEDIDEKFNTFRVTTENELIDLVEKRISKKVSINLNEDEINNFEKIENLLKEKLFSVN